MIVAEDPTEAELVAMQHAIEEPQQQQQIQHQQPIKQIVQTASGKQQTLYSCKEWPANGSSHLLSKQ